MVVACEHAFGWRPRTHLPHCADAVRALLLPTLLLPAGNLVAVFTHTFSSAPTSDLIYAFGSVSSSGSLETHITSNLPYGPLSLAWKASASASTPSSPSPSPVLEPVVAAPTQRPGSKGDGDHGSQGEHEAPGKRDGDGGGDHAGAPLPDTLPGGTSAPMETTQPDGAVAPAPAAGTSAPAQDANCTLSVGGTNTDYPACTTVR